MVAKVQSYPECSDCGEGMMKMQQQKPIVSLEDPHVVYELCFEFVDALCDAHERLHHGSISEQDCSQIVEHAVGWFAATLAGRNPIVAPAENWSGAPLGRYLRIKFALDMIMLDDEERELFADDESVIFYAVNRMFEDLGRIIDSLSVHGDDDAEADARAIHELCVRWTEIFTNKPFSREPARD